MLSRDQIQFYHDNGYLLVEDAVTPEQLAALRRITHEFIERSREVTESDEVFDLDEGHSRAQPRLTRIKLPHRQHPVYDETLRSAGVTGVLKDLLGPDVALQTSKLNTKAPGGGAAVEWHQDWAFYPHTNDDLCAVGFMMDDCGPENGPLLIVPGTHRGPIHDHHAGDRFCGAIDPERADVDFAAAVPLTGPAGSITVHHARVIHGSAPNRSRRPRRLLLHQYRAADAWPLLGLQRGMDWDAYNALLITGEPSLEPRMELVPVRLPLPPADHQGSIYENQRALGRRYFAEVVV